MKYLIDPSDTAAKARAQRVMDEIKERWKAGKRFTAEIDDYKPEHSNEQQGYLWRSLNDYGQHLGYNRQEVQDILWRELKCRFFGIEKTIRRGDMIVSVPKGSSKRLDKQTYSDLIEELIIMAGEDGCVVPPPLEG